MRREKERQKGGQREECKDEGMEGKKERVGREVHGWMDGWMERRISRQPIQHTAIQRSKGEWSHHSTAPTPSI
jgi:hypothetical protein